MSGSLPAGSLAEMPSTPTARKIALGVCAILAGLALSTAHLRGIAVPSINGPSFQSTYEIGASFCDAITAFLLIVQFRQTGSVSLVCLAAGYLYTAIIAAVHVLTIPGVLLVANVLDAIPSSPLLLRFAWLAGQPIGALAFVVTMRRPSLPLARTGRVVAAACGAAVVLATAASLLATRYADLLPDLSDRPENWSATYLLALPLLLAIQVSALTAVVSVTRCRTILSLWLAVALASGLAEAVIGWWLVGIGMGVSRRYSLLFYIAHLAGALSASLLLLALLHQIAALYARLIVALRNVEDSEQRLIAQQRIEAVAQLAGGVAHDFNNLLTVITGNLDLLRTAGPTERDRKRIDMAAQAAKRGADLTRQILTFARRQLLHPMYHDIDALLDQTEPLIQSATAGNMIVQRMRHPDAPACCVDRAEFELAVLNIVVNAKQAMGDGGLLIIRTEVVNLDGTRRHGSTDPDLPPGRFVRIGFTDNGPGMPLDVMTRAFEPFFTTKEAGQGSGLGLSQVNGFARQTGGDTALRSVPGRGTTVEIYLPLAPAVIRADAQTDTKPRGRLTAKVLLVEDSDDVRQAVGALLRSIGCQVLFASNGSDGLKLVDRHHGALDLLLSDIVMPGMTGVVLAEHAHRLCPNLPVLLMTGFAATPAANSNLVVLRKPFSETELEERVGTAIRQRVAKEP